MRLDQRGMSMVQVMVAFGLMGALAVGLMKMTENQQKQAKTTEFKLNEANFKNKLSIIANKYDFCSANFVGLRKGAEITELLKKDPDPNSAEDVTYLKIYSELQPGDVGYDSGWNNSKLFVTKIKLLSVEEEETAGYIADATNPPAHGADGTGETYMRVWLTRGKPGSTKQSHFGSKEHYIDVPVNVKFGIVATCSKVFVEDVEPNKTNQINELLGYCDASTTTLDPSCTTDVTIDGGIEKVEIMKCVDTDTDATTNCDVSDQLLRTDAGSLGTTALYNYFMSCRIVDANVNPYIYDCLSASGN